MVGGGLGQRGDPSPAGGSGRAPALAWGSGAQAQILGRALYRSWPHHCCPGSRCPRHR